MRRIGFLWCAYEFVGDFVLLYALETLLFLDTGLSTGEITSLLVVWSLTTVLAEVPSGVLADVLPRRLIITVAPLLRTVGFGLWVFAPSYPSFLIGFMLWGVCAALQSGSVEALVYDELKRHDATDRYTRLAGRARAAATIAVLTSMLLAPTVFGYGGYVALGIGSLAAGVLNAVVGAAFPEDRTGRDAEFEGLRAYGRTLAAGIREVRNSRIVLFAVVMMATVMMIWGSLEEFVALLSVDLGADRQTVPYLVAALTAAVTAGSLFAERFGDWPWRRLGWGLIAAGLVLVAGAWYGGMLGFAVMVSTFAVFAAVGVVCEARLQHAISGPARATVTSVAGLLYEAGAVVFYLSYALVATGYGHGAGFGYGGALYVLVGVSVVVVIATRRRARRTAVVRV